VQRDWRSRPVGEIKHRSRADLLDQIQVIVLCISSSGPLSQDRSSHKFGFVNEKLVGQKFVCFIVIEIVIFAYIEYCVRNLAMCLLNKFSTRN